MSIAHYIEMLNRQNGVSGDEAEVSQCLQKILEKNSDSIYTDPMGSLIATRKSASSGGLVMLEAHMDEIGLMVKKVDEDGFLLVVPVGGIDPRILPGNEVIVHGTKDMRGVVGAKPPHIMTQEEYEQVLDFEQLYIDIGLERAEAEKLVSVGDSITFCGDIRKLSNGYIACKCHDDRSSVAVLLEVFDRLSGVDLGYDLCLALSVQEEVGMRGAMTNAYSVNPDFAIAIDVTHAATPDQTTDVAKAGCGPVICLGPNIHKSLSEHFLQTLTKNNISYALEIEGGNTGTDAWVIQTAREGIPCMLLSLALKYMHTPIETIKLSDCEKTAEALECFLKSFNRTEDVLCF